MRVKETARRSSTSSTTEASGESETNWLWAKFLSVNSLSSASYTTVGPLTHDDNDVQGNMKEKLSKAEKIDCSLLFTMMCEQISMEYCLRDSLCSKLV